MKNNIITIDANKQNFGRFASKIAILLMNKNSCDYQKNCIPDSKIKIVNINSLKFTGKKAVQKTFIHYSNYPGGVKKRNASVMTNKEIFMKIIYSMLPKNHSKNKLLKRLIIE